MNPIRAQWQQWMRTRAKTHSKTIVAHHNTHAATSSINRSTPATTIAITKPQEPSTTSLLTPTHHTPDDTMTTLVVQSIQKLTSIRRSHMESPHDTSFEAKARNALKNLALRPGLQPDHFTTRQAVRMLNILAYFNIAPNRYAEYSNLIKVLCDTITLRSYDLNGSVLVTIIISLLSLQPPNLPLLLKSLAPRIAHITDELIPAEISTVLYVYTKTSAEMTKEMVAGLFASLTLYLPLAALQDLTRSILALDRWSTNNTMKSNNKEMLVPIVAVFIQKLRQVNTTVSGEFIIPRDVIHAVCALSRFGFDDRTLYDLCCRFALLHASELEPNVLVSLLQSFRNISYRNQHNFSLLARAVLENPLSTCSECGKVLQAAAWVNVLTEDVWLSGRRVVKPSEMASLADAATLFSAFTLASINENRRGEGVVTENTIMAEKLLGYLVKNAAKLSVGNIVSVLAALSRTSSDDDEKTSNAVGVVIQKLEELTTSAAAASTPAVFPSTLSACELYNAILQGHYRSKLPSSVISAMEAAREQQATS